MSTSKVLPWSYSTLTAFETCPRRYYLTKIAKVVTEQYGAEAKHGNEVHKAIELDLKGERPLDEKYAKYRPMVDVVKKYKGEQMIEHKFGVTENFEPTNFFGRDVWCRGVIDYAVIIGNAAVSIDWKTGKPKQDSQQMRLFAAATFTMNENIDVVRTGFAWLGHNKMDVETFKREDASEIWGDFTRRVIRMEKAAEQNKFPPNPSGLCRNWCPVGRNNCDFCGV